MSLKSVGINFILLKFNNSNLLKYELTYGFVKGKLPFYLSLRNLVYTFDQSPTML